LISLVVAASENDVIGRAGDLPWRLPGDLRRFRDLTMGKPIVMGRKTWESIGKPLPGRQNIVITRQRDYVAKGCDIVFYPAAALLAAKGAGEIMIIGGSRIYRQFLRRASRVYLTRVHVTIEGDAFFPGLDECWELESSESHSADEQNEHAFTFEYWQRADAA